MPVFGDGFAPAPPPELVWSTPGWEITSLIVTILMRNTIRPLWTEMRDAKALGRVLISLSERLVSSHDGHLGPCEEGLLRKRGSVHALICLD